jgi:parallel beta helix pectate lyase-like protein
MYVLLFALTLTLASCATQAPSDNIADSFKNEIEILEINHPTTVPLTVHTLPAKIVRFGPRGILNLQKGQQLLISGRVEAAKDQFIFEVPESARVFGFQSDYVSPRWWGARGDGKTNDTEAFQRAADVIQERGGGRILIPDGFYIVGGQYHDPTSKKPFKLLPKQILSLKDLRSPLIIEGDGTKKIKMQLQAGLKFGSFDPMTGKIFEPKGRFLDRDYASETGVVIDVSQSPSVHIKNLDLDGNLETMILGGSFGDQGRQLTACGIRLYNNTTVHIQDVDAHDHALDGIIIGHIGVTEKSPPYPHLIENVTSEYNARQGLSVVGGNSVIIRNSKFNHTGKKRFHSSPGAGIDLEAEKSIIRNVLIENVESINNTGVGIVADSGDSADVVIRKSRVVGTTHYSLWLRKPRYRLEDSHITGTVVNLFSKGSDAFIAKNTTFDDVDYISPEGINLGAYHPSSVIEMDHSGGQILFDGVTIIGTKSRPLWIDNGTIKNSTIILKKSDFKPGDFAILARETNLENVIFKFEPLTTPAPLTTPWYIAAGSCEKGATQRSHVQILSSMKGSSYLNWCSPRGRSGLVFP